MDKPTLPSKVTSLPGRARPGIPDAQYRLMVESVVDYAIFMLDPKGMVLTWNKGAERLKGYKEDDILGHHFSVYYPPELLAKNWPAYELDIATTTGKYEEEGWRIRKDGTRFWASVTITRLTDPSGVLLGFTKVTRDLTERQRQEEAVRASEERIRLLVEGVKDYAIFMLDPSGHVVSWNLGAKANTGYEAQEIIGKHFSVFYPAEVAATGFPSRELTEAKAVGRFEDEGWRIRKDGSRFWANVVITALFDSTGRHRGFAKVTRDLSERRRVRDLEEESKRLQNFLALLGHELRNPLAPIANAAELLRRTNKGANVERMATVIQRQVDQMTRLVNDLLDVGRVANGKIQLERKPVELLPVIDEAIEASRPAAKAKEQSVSVEAAADLWVFGDRARLIQIVSNLLANAVKFTPVKGHVWVELTASSQDGDSVEIRVRDDGPGIAPDMLSRVFNLFEQGAQDLNRPESGLGLGLALVRQLVELHGGEVEARSRGVPGEGSEFVVRLPRVERPENEATEIQPTLVLVVDDVEDSSETLALLIETMGYSVVRASTGPEALAKIKSKRPALVLLDIGLPGLSGWEIAEKVRLEMETSPMLVAVTGYGQASGRLAAFESGFAAHLVKPVKPGALEELLRRLLPLSPKANAN